MSCHSHSNSAYFPSPPSDPGLMSNSSRVVCFKDDVQGARLLPSRRVEFQTAGSMHAIASGAEAVVEVQSRSHNNKTFPRTPSLRLDEAEPFYQPPMTWEQDCATSKSTPTHRRTSSFAAIAATRPKRSAEKPPFMEPEPRLRGTQLFPPPPPPLKQAAQTNVISNLGPPYLQIYRFSLPSPMLPILDQIKQMCEDYALKSPTGWRTHLYSLTKQDIAVNEVPGAQEIVEPINDFVLSTVEKLIGRPVGLDCNQPHVLKYDESHASVPLHHDLCSVTVSIMLSGSHEYTGGGCFLPALGRTLRLEQGEVLLHPGNLLHAGCEIHSGTRYLMVYFCSS